MTLPCKLAWAQTTHFLHFMVMGGELNRRIVNQTDVFAFFLRYNLFNMTFMFRVLDGFSSPIYMVTRSRNWPFVITNLTNINEGNVRYPAEWGCFSASIRYWSAGRIVCWCHFLVSVVINFSEQVSWVQIWRGEQQLASDMCGESHQRSQCK
jgi:hypothetical protein